MYSFSWCDSPVAAELAAVRQKADEGFAELAQAQRRLLDTETELLASQQVATDALGHTNIETLSCHCLLAKFYDVVVSIIVLLKDGVMVNCGVQNTVEAEGKAKQLQREHATLQSTLTQLQETSSGSCVLLTVSKNNCRNYLYGLSSKDAQLLSCCFPRTRLVLLLSLP